MSSTTAGIIFIGSLVIALAAVHRPHPVARSASTGYPYRIVPRPPPGVAGSFFCGLVVMVISQSGESTPRPSHRLYRLSKCPSRCIRRLLAARYWSVKRTYHPSCRRATDRCHEERERIRESPRPGARLPRQSEPQSTASCRGGQRPAGGCVDALAAGGGQASYAALSASLAKGTGLGEGYRRRHGGRYRPARRY